ncbi:hypothetical protein, partial [Neoroseomonas rubea]|uniref:hypothetical protein n=1 Tax=Neoroseomonas rubea TaxID=2748666 RepID=UPI0018E0579B
MVGTSRVAGASAALAVTLLLNSGVLTPAYAQSASDDAATIAELRRQLDEMRRRLEMLESRAASRQGAPVVAVAPAAAPRRPPPRNEAAAAAADARA